MIEERLRVRSKHRTVSSALLLVPFTLISSLAIGNSALNAAAQPRKNTTVFAVAGEPDDYHLDAVVPSMESNCALHTLTKIKTSRRNLVKSTSPKAGLID